MSKNKICKDSPIPKFIYLKSRRRDGVESLTTLEEGEFKVPIDGCITENCKYLQLYIRGLFFRIYLFLAKQFSQWIVWKMAKIKFSTVWGWVCVCVCGVCVGVCVPL